MGISVTPSKVCIHFFELITANVQNWDTQLNEKISPMNTVGSIWIGKRKKKTILHGVIYFPFCFVFPFFFSYREIDVKGVSSFSKCKMYDVNWTSIQSWDYENWNSTRHHEKLNVLGKYWQMTKLNKRNNWKKKKTNNKRHKNKIESQDITFALSSHCTLHCNDTKQTMCTVHIGSTSNQFIRIAFCTEKNQIQHFLENAKSTLARITFKFTPMRLILYYKVWQKFIENVWTHRHIH